MQVQLGGSPSDPRAYYPLWAMLITLSAVTMCLAFCGLGGGNTTSSNTGTAGQKTAAFERNMSDEVDNEDDEEAPILGYHNNTKSAKK